MSEGLKSKLLLTVFAIFLLILGFAAGQYYLSRVYERQLEVSYRRALAEFATHLQKLALETGRARVAKGVQQKQLIASNIRRLVYVAQCNMGELPLGELQLERIAHLLDQVYDNSYAYIRDELESTDLERLYGQVNYVSHELQNLLVHKEQEFPWVSWHEYLSTTVAVPGVMRALTLINEGLDEFQSPRRSGEIIGAEITREQALETAKNFSGEFDLTFQVTNESRGLVPTYTVEAKDEQHQILVEVSQKGGVVLWMVSTAEVVESVLSLDEMVAKGADFLKERGFPPLYLTDAQVLQHRATLTFVPKRDGILRYGEPVKVQVSAGDGSILGFWGTPFHVAQSRNRPVEVNSQEVNWNVQDKVRSDLLILDQKPALIVNERDEEVLVTRLGVQHGDEYYLIYLNSQTGEEEQIVQVSSPKFF